MGTWGYKPFENDAAADWLYDLQEASETKFLLDTLEVVTKSRGKVDLDDALEGLAAAQIVCGARYDPPRNVPRTAAGWIKLVGFVPSDEDVRLALRVVTMTEKNSELAEEWKEEGKLPMWRKELARLSKQLEAALRMPLPARKKKSAVRRETLAELILSVADDPKKERRAELQKKLLSLANPDAPVGGKWNGETLNRLTPLHWVASRGLVPEAKILIALGANVNVRLLIFSLPIVFAMDNGHIEMVALLLASGADKQQALRSAIGSDMPDIVQLVLEHQVDVNLKGDGGWTPILWAAYNLSAASLKLLLQHGAAVAPKLDTGDTVLHLAMDCSASELDKNMKQKQLEIFRLLVQAGAKLNEMNSDGKTPLDLAEQSSCTEIIEVLRRKGAKPAKDLR